MNKTRDCRYSRLSDDDKVGLSVTSTLVNDAIEFFHDVDFNPIYGKPVCNALIKLCTLLDEVRNHIEKTITDVLTSGTTEVPDDEKYIVKTELGNVECTDVGFICPKCGARNGFDYIEQNQACGECGLEMEINWGGEEDEA